MDNAGWHAHRRADKEARHAAERADFGGRYDPVEEVVQPIPDRANYAADYYAPQYARRDASQASAATDHSGLNLAELSTLSAVQRSKAQCIRQMHPRLQFMAGPLLRYDTVDANYVWHGAAMIVTSDAGSDYEPHPTLTYQATPVVPSPNPNTHFAHVQAVSYAPHPADPHATSQPVSYGRASIDEFNGNGVQSNGHGQYPSPSSIPPQSAVGQEIYVYTGDGGTYTFWRFMIQVQLGPNEMQVRYSVNNGIELSFFVPAWDQSMRWAAHSCNGFSAGVNTDEFRGPGFKSGYDPMWVDLLQKHVEEPFHAMVGGGDQLYCDALMREPELQHWVKISKLDEKMSYRLTGEVAACIDRFYFNHYCTSFRRGAFARANSSIPMLNMCDDHDIVSIDGFGSYPDNLQRSPMFTAIGSRGYFFFLLFQCFINPQIDGIEDQKHPFKSMVIGSMGPYVGQPSHSILTYLGPRVRILLLDCRAERRREQVCSQAQYRRVFEALSRLPAGVEHLVVQIGIPIAYPRMVFLENFLESKLNPLTALGRSGVMGLGGFVNKFNGQAELLDDLSDHWTAKSHKSERNWFVHQLQRYAHTRRTRVTFLSGDVHCAAVGVFRTLVPKAGKNKSEGLPPAMDHRYMLNIVTSAIVNTPPPDGVLTMVSSLASKTHRTMHEVETDEGMVPLFENDTDGSPRKHKYVMGRRNWCSTHWDNQTGELVFDIRVEKEKGLGISVGYAVKAAPPQWNPAPVQ
ncbi:hypothetical protein CONPUDRAFT_162294 [Coniophora puteana RWD-64-598 SS2]|uniref:PhoD-like phosphatase domain-containing protein n=1 Tax=Coniophora puteana (strain RWD-64-598) TaxID=741705 RepID=A0A5M3N122_CONPW|nr:uncharacterized protein CONPUDRAFT_162294 [Coniophora puteana RWD-64-598 SS2]EIW84986.1 hypothetical protein CONPUDRAFT_162294 [Coniophora puteana RWD-64-598 SS2]